MVSSQKRPRRSGAAEFKGTTGRTARPVEVKGTPASSSTSKKKCRGPMYRFCPCGMRLSNLAVNPHSLCVSCRRGDCSFIDRCGECYPLSYVQFAKLKSHGLKMKRLHKYRQKVRMSQVRDDASRISASLCTKLSLPSRPTVAPVSHVPISVAPVSAVQSIVTPPLVRAQGNSPVSDFVSPHDSVSQFTPRENKSSFRSSVVSEVLSKVDRQLKERDNQLKSELKEEIGIQVGGIKELLLNVLGSRPPISNVENQDVTSGKNAHLPIMANSELVEPVIVPRPISGEVITSVLPISPDVSFSPPPPPSFFHSAPSHSGPMLMFCIVLAPRKFSWIKFKKKIKKIQ